MEIQGQGYSREKIIQLQKECEEMKDKTEREELQSLILNHMLERDKLSLLFEREPLPRKKKKLTFYLD